MSQGRKVSELDDIPLKLAGLQTMEEFIMKKSLTTSVIFGSFMSITSLASAGTIGNLNWDGTSDYITTAGSTTTYVQFGKYAGLTYAETLNALQTEEALSGFRIAGMSDAVNYYNNLLPPSHLGYGLTLPDYVVNNVNPFDDGALGNNYSDLFDMAWFRTGESPDDLGLIRLIHAADMAQFSTDQQDISYADRYTTSGQYSDYLGSWLLVSDSVPVSAVPIPAAAFMFAPALLGFLGLRRKARSA